MTDHSVLLKLTWYMYVCLFILGIYIKRCSLLKLHQWMWVISSPYPSTLPPSASLFSTTLRAASSDVLVCSSLFWANTSRPDPPGKGVPGFPAWHGSAEVGCEGTGAGEDGAANAMLWATVKFGPEGREIKDEFIINAFWRCFDWNIIQPGRVSECQCYLLLMPRLCWAEGVLKQVNQKLSADSLAWTSRSVGVSQVWDWVCMSVCVHCHPALERPCEFVHW